MTAIRWAAPAADDLNDIARFITNDSPQAASNFIERVDSAVRQLRSHPQSGRVVPELEKHNLRSYRELALTPWRLFYRFDRNTVYVLAVIDGRRNIEDVLLRRLTRQAD